MARFGTWAPLAANWASQPRMSQVDIISLHTMVGSLPVVDGMFRRNGFGGTFSHFGVGGNGECTQWQDTAYRAAANYNGNWHIISVECADVGAPFPAWNTNDGSAVPAFSDAQIETLARLIATIAPAHNIPIALIPDAKPGRRGIGYHRQGVPGYMVAGAEQWSTAQGKVCPGNRRIAQIPQIIARAQQIVNGDDMPLNDDDLRKIQAVIWDAVDPGNKGPDNRMGNMQYAAHMGVRAVYDTLTPGVAGVKTDGAVYSMLRDTKSAVDALKGGAPVTAAAGPVSLSDADVNRIADALVAKLAGRLQS